MQWAHNLQSDFLIHLSLVRWRLVEISALMASWLLRHTAPNSFKPSTAKLQSSKLGFSFSVSATHTSRCSSSRDQELAWATHCRVAVMKASGLNNPDMRFRLHYTVRILVHEIKLDSPPIHTLKHFS